MSDGQREKHGWLEVVGNGVDEQNVHCPRRDKDMPLRECIRCQRYSSLALDPSGKHIYLDCDWTGAEAVRADSVAHPAAGPRAGSDPETGAPTGAGAAERSGEDE